MSKELEAFGLIKRTCELYIETTRFLIGSDIIANQIKEAVETVQNRLESIDNANPSEELEILDDFKNGLVNKEIGMVMFQQYWFFTQIEKVKQALLKAEQDKKKLNKIEKLTNLFYSERRKIGQEYIKWCEKNNAVFDDATTMITWVLAIKLKEVLKNE